MPVGGGGQGGQGHGRGGVAGHRFEQGGGQGQADFAQLFSGQEAVVFATDNDRRGQGDAVVPELVQALRGLLEQAVLASQTQKLFGETSARKRPQACAGAAAEDDRGDLDHVLLNVCIGI